MKRNVKVTIGVLTIFIGLCVLLSTYFNSTKLEVFDEMNEQYYNQVVSIADEIEEKEETVTEVKQEEENKSNVVKNNTTTNKKKTNTNKKK